MKKLFILLLFCLPLASFPQAKKPSPDHYLLLGTYTHGKSIGVYVYKFNDITGNASLVSSVATPNPSYLAVSPNHKYVYSVNENKDSGMLTAFSFDKHSGHLHKLNSQPTRGDDPCYVAVDKTGKWAFAANYSGGSFSVFPINADGSLKPPATTIAHHGTGPNKERQEKAHVHCTVLAPDNKFLFVCDLGMDKIVEYRFDAIHGEVSSSKLTATDAPPGSGPRHLVFSPSGKYAYLVEELSGTVLVYRYNNGMLKQVQSISSVPNGFHGFAGSADIHVSPDGRFLYGSNRGESNTIVIYAINPVTGKLTVNGFVPVLGKAPRNFNFDPSGRFLLVANQDTDEVVIFNRDKKTGLLKDSGERIKAGNPVCIKWIN